MAEVLGQVGERLGVWRLEEAVAEAPSGQWWRASNASSNQAAWLLRYAQAADAGAVLLRMAAAEGQPWRHPDIAWPLDSGLTHTGHPYVVMPLLEGLPLLSQLGAVSLRRRMEWVVQLCELLLLARGHGLSMVEIDPSLLWLGPQQQLRLHALAMVRTDADAQSLGPLKGQISQAAQALQCPQARPGEPADAAAQTYSVGMLMGLLVTGRLPGSDTPVGEALHPMGQWLALRAEARTALDALLHKAVHPDPSQRLPDLQTLAEAVEVWLDLSGGMVSGVGTLDTPPTSMPAPLSAPTPPAWPAADGEALTVPMAPLAAPARPSGAPGASSPAPTKPAPAPGSASAATPPNIPLAAPSLPAAPSKPIHVEAQRNRWLLLALCVVALLVAVGLHTTGWLP